MAAAGNSVTPELTGTVLVGCGSEVASISPSQVVTRPFNTSGGLWGGLSVALDYTNNFLYSGGPRKLSFSGAVSSHGTATGQIAIDSQSNVYTTNSSNGDVSKTTSSGVTTFITNLSPQGNCIAIDAFDNVYIGRGNGNIAKITSAGVVTPDWNTNFNSNGGYAQTLSALTSKNSIYFIKGIFQFVIYGFNQDGTTTSYSMGSSVVSVRGMTVDPYDNIYIFYSDPQNKVGKFVPSTQTWTPNWCTTTGISSFSGNGADIITTDLAGNVYVCGSNGSISVVAKITPAGVVTPTYGNLSSASLPESISFVDPPTVPAALTIGTAFNWGDGSVGVPFTKNSSGGLPLSAITITASPGGATATGTSSPVFFSGLTNSTAYTFTVTATNQIGTSPASSASNSVTAAANASGTLFALNSGSSVSRITPAGSALTPFTSPSLTVNSGWTDIAIDNSSGNIYLTNLVSDSVTKIAPSGLTTIDWAYLGPSADPLDMVIDSSGNVFTGNSGSISKITPAGAVTVNWASVAGTKAMAINSSNTIYAGLANTDVARITSAGVVTGVWASLGFGYVPSAMVVSSSGDVFVAIRNGGSVSRITSAGVVTNNWANIASNTEYEMVIDSSNNIYVTDVGGSKVIKITSAGVVSSSWASTSGSPYGITIDLLGNIYVGNLGGDIQKITPAGVVTTLTNTGAFNNIGIVCYNPPTAPAAPTIGTATAASATSASVAFTPNSTGGSPITGYTVTSSPGGITATGSSSPITVTGLTTGVAYTFTVTATNAIGTSSPSAASNSVTPPVAGTVFSSNQGAGGNTITKVAINGTGSTFVSSITNPSGSVLDAGGNLYVYRSGGIIDKIDSSGSVTSSWATGVSAGGTVVLVIDSSGNIYALGASTANVAKITPSGVVTSNWATLSFNAAGGPQSGMAIDPSGNIYIPNTGAIQGRITRITPAGVVNENWFANFGNYPQCVATDSSGNVWIGSSISPNGSITKVDSSGSSVGYWSVAADAIYKITANANGQAFGLGQATGDIYKVASGTLSTLVSGTNPGATGGLICDNSYVYAERNGFGIGKYDVSSGSTVATITQTPTPLYFSIQK